MRKRIYIYADHTSNTLVETDVPLTQAEMEEKGLSYIAYRLEGTE